MNFNINNKLKLLFSNNYKKYWKHIKRYGCSFQKNRKQLIRLKRHDFEWIDQSLKRITPYDLCILCINRFQIFFILIFKKTPTDCNIIDLIDLKCQIELGRGVQRPIKLKKSLIRIILTDYNAIYTLRYWNTWVLFILIDSLRYFILWTPISEITETCILNILFSHSDSPEHAISHCTVKCYSVSSLLIKLFWLCELQT